MTAIDTQPIDVPEDEWRGRITDDQSDDLPIDESVPRRREARALLGSLLRPYQLTVALLALVVVVENLARLSVPILVQRGIDRAQPELRPRTRARPQAEARASIGQAFTW